MSKKFLLHWAVSGLVMAASSAQASSGLVVDATAFKDEQGRTLILRGVKLGGSSKVPYVTSEDPTKVSYIGRPFPLAEADQHFSRLKSWGLTTVRLIIMSEAVEHAGPGQYDEAYLDYLHELVQRGRRYGINFIVDLHQDFYSRATGGDGAPYWTVTKLSLGPDKTNELSAPHKQPPRGPGYWPPTAARFSVNTMDTLFWAGNDFAPGLKVDGVPVQDWLQGHSVGAIKRVAVKLRNLDNVVAYDTYNEPNHGYIRVKDLREPEFFMQFVGRHAAPKETPPSYWDLMLAASGYKPEKSAVPANNLWMSEANDIWRKYGVWGVVNGKPKLLKPDYFSKVGGQVPDHADYVAALQRAVAKEVREVVPGALIVQQPVLGDLKKLDLHLPGMINQPHWYDGIVLMSKKYEPNVTYAMTGWPSMREEKLVGREAVLTAYLKRVNELKSLSQPMGNLPTLIAETGLPYDLNDGLAYKTGDYTAQETLAGLMYETLDRTLSSYLIWNYTADNRNIGGDGWGNEDLSIFNLDLQKNPKDINSGGRTLPQVVRPYPMATAGTPVSIVFDPATHVFEYRFTADPKVKAPTQIFVPKFHYPRGYRVEATNAKYVIGADPSTLSVTATSGDVVVKVMPRG